MPCIFYAIGITNTKNFVDSTISINVQNCSLYTCNGDRQKVRHLKHERYHCCFIVTYSVFHAIRITHTHYR